jgi:hypothetical protein
MVPWGDLRHRLLILDHVKVTGARYLDEGRIRERSGLKNGQDLLSLDLTRVRQLVLLEPRLVSATVHRHGLRGVEIEVVERVPTLTVEHGEPWELDGDGVLLEPLQSGVVADVPMLVGPDFSNRLAGSLVQTPEVKRGLAWTSILNDNALRLTGQVSEIDVSDPRLTRLVMMNGVRVVAPIWPNGARQSVRTPSHARRSQCEGHDAPRGRRAIQGPDRRARFEAHDPDRHDHDISRDVSPRGRDPHGAGDKDVCRAGHRHDEDLVHHRRPEPDRGDASPRHRQRSE